MLLLLLRSSMIERSEIMRIFLLAVFLVLGGCVAAPAPPLSFPPPAPVLVPLAAPPPPIVVPAEPPRYAHPYGPRRAHKPRCVAVQTYRVLDKETHRTVVRRRVACR